MNKNNFSRLKFFLGIFAGIVVLHLIVIVLLVNTSGKDKAAENSQTQQTGSDTSPGFLKRLFQNSPAPKKEEKKKKAELPPAKKKPQLRFKKPSTDKNFAKPLIFIYARRGKLPENLVRGDDSRSAILVDMNTRRVLWEKNSNQPVPIASMSKMMTMLLTMEYLEANPALSLNTAIPVSPDVLKLPRSGVIWLDPRESFTFSELLRCAAIKSANDAALQLALRVAGKEELFVARMNRRAKELNMKNTAFINAHGLPDKNQKQSLSTAHDMVLLGERMLEYPFLMNAFQTLSDSIREGDKKTVFRNTNSLIRNHMAKAEGMKTGFTRKAGFCVTFSAKRNGRRIMGCVTGFKTAKERDNFCKQLLDWAFEGCPDNRNTPRSVNTTKRRKR